MADLSRRSLLRGLFAAPLVITTPGILMPVKAVRTPFAFVSGTLLDGTHFTKTLYDEIPASYVPGLDWFDDVAGISEYTYADPSSVYNSQAFQQYNKKGRPHQDIAMKPPVDRLPYKSLSDDLKDYEVVAFAKIDQLKEEDRKFHQHTLDPI